MKKKVFNVGEEGCSGLMKYINGLPSWESPFLCGHAKILPEKLFVIKKSSICEYGAGRTVCPVYTRHKEDWGIECPGLNDISVTKFERGAYGHCGVVGKRVFIKVK